jgi:hypothetical protein
VTRGRAQGLAAACWYSEVVITKSSSWLSGIFLNKYVSTPSMRTRCCSCGVKKKRRKLSVPFAQVDETSTCVDGFSFR